MKKHNYTIKEKAVVYEILSDLIENCESLLDSYSIDYGENPSSYIANKISGYNLVIEILNGLEI